jgi:DNA-binding MarR family transcriptional regulator
VEISYHSPIIAPASDSQSREIVSLWEDAVCLHKSQKSFISRKSLRTNKLFANFALGESVQRRHDQIFDPYRICVIIARRHGTTTMGELSDALHIPLSSATRMVNRMIASGFIARQIDPSDHRVVRINLTQAGVQFYRTIHNHAKRRVRVALSHLTLEERGQLVALVRKVITALADMS